MIPPMTSSRTRNNETASAMTITHPSAMWPVISEINSENYLEQRTIRYFVRIGRKLCRLSHQISWRGCKVDTLHHQRGLQTHFRIPLLEYPPIEE
jgi:hypothetical protein